MIALEAERNAAMLRAREAAAKNVQAAQEAAALAAQQAVESEARSKAMNASIDDDGMAAKRGAAAMAEPDETGGPDEGDEVDVETIPVDLDTQTAIQILEVCIDPFHA
jgi:hypothetical protein